MERRRRKTYTSEEKLLAGKDAIPGSTRRRVKSAS